MPPTVLWKFRYKHRLVETGVIETNSVDEKVAAEVAADYLSLKVPYPGVRVLPGSLVPFADHSEDAMLRRREQARAAVSASGPDVGASAGRGGGGIGAVDDPSSPKAKAARVGA